MQEEAVGEERFVVVEESEELSREVAKSFAAQARAAVGARGRFAVALPGGEAAHGFFRQLAQEPLRASIPWEKVHLFWTDERCLPQGASGSFLGAATDCFISRVELPRANVHAVPVGQSPDAAAMLYGNHLLEFFGGEVRFDAVYLTLGRQGGVASLFPNAAVLRQRARPAYATFSEEDEEHRVTLTPGVINAARAVELLAPQGELAELLQSLLAGARDPLALPAQLIHPAEGELTWWMTIDSAARLDPTTFVPQAR